MNTADFIRKTQESCEYEIKEIEHMPGQGRCEDFTAYKTLCGELSGLNRAIGIMGAKLKQLHEED